MDPVTRYRLLSMCDDLLRYRVPKELVEAVRAWVREQTVDKPRGLR